MRRIGFLAVALVMVASVTAGCAASSTVERSVSVTPARADAVSSAYDMRLGEVVASSAGTSTSVFIPGVSAGLWVRMSALDGTFTRDVCQVSITDTVQSSSDVCSVEVFERDEHGNLQGVILHVDGLDDAGYFETDARKLRRTDDGGWSGETGTRSVKLWGFLTPRGEK